MVKCIFDYHHPTPPTIVVNPLSNVSYSIDRFSCTLVPAPKAQLGPTFEVPAPGLYEAAIVIADGGEEQAYFFKTIPERQAFLVDLTGVAGF